MFRYGREGVLRYSLSLCACFGIAGYSTAHAIRPECAVRHFAARNLGWLAALALQTLRPDSAGTDKRFILGKVKAGEGIPANAALAELVCEYFS
jgi:hypothetical protein